MRKTIDRQLPLVPALKEHPHIAELSEISRILDEHPEIAQAAHADLVRGVRPDKGCKGLSGDQVVRAAILYRSKRWSFAELQFELSYHAAYRSFCRLGLTDYPSKSSLHRDIAKIEPQTWEAIHRVVISYAQRIGVEDGKWVRVDCTVTETNIHEPSDSSLLWDCVRVLCRELERASKVVSIRFRDHEKRAKRRAFGIRNAKTMEKRMPLYRDLLKVTHKTLSYAKPAVTALEKSKHVLASARAQALREVMALTARVIDQTERRVLGGESVPAQEKVVSIFEPHTDIIRKDGRETLYGHKLCLAAGASNLITDCVILEGNDADAKQTVSMMKRHVEQFGAPAQSAAFDGGFASKDNLADLKALGIENVAFSKTLGISISDMVKQSWLYQRLRDFRAGIEGLISFLKRVFGLDCCRWKGPRSFAAYVWSSIVSANLLVLARHALS
jgi:IS5 family transposase